MMKNLMNRIFKRRRFIVYRKLQLTLMAISFGYVILFFIIMGMYLFIPLILELDKVDMGSSRALVATNRILYLHEKFWPALLLCLFAIGCHSIFISHKIAGPLYRFNLIFKAMREGIIPAPTQLRAGDYLYSEMENINQMLERLRTKHIEFQEAQAHLNRSIIKCKETVSDSSKNELIKKIDDLVMEGEKLEGMLRYFQVIS